MATQALIGISGWRYAPWRGEFYPPGLPQRDELAYARERCFRRSSSTAASIRCSGPNTTSAGTSRYRRVRVRDQRLTLHHPHAAAARRRDGARELLRVGPARASSTSSGRCSGSCRLRCRSMRERLDGNSSRCCRARRRRPRELARRHDERVEGRAYLDVHEDRELRHALEVRHPSFATPKLVELLREHDVALVVADTAGRWPFLEDVTADFVYVRLHGDVKLYESGYTDAALERWAARIRAWRDGREAAVGEARRAGAAALEAARRLRLLRQRHQGARAVRRDEPRGQSRGARAMKKTQRRARAASSPAIAASATSRDTPEPSGARQRRDAGGALQYVVQKHDATRLHYDFRLEHDGVLKSWAVPKEPSLQHDGPPPRGAGRGSSARLRRLRGRDPRRGIRRRQRRDLGPRPLDSRSATPTKGLKEGKLDFELDGQRLKGRFTLVRMAERGKRKPGKDNWLLLKRHDRAAGAQRKPAAPRARRKRRALPDPSGVAGRAPRRVADASCRRSSRRP